MFGSLQPQQRKMAKKELCILIKRQLSDNVLGALSNIINASGCEASKCFNKCSFSFHQIFEFQL